MSRIAAVVASAALLFACSGAPRLSASGYPLPVDPSRVGDYPASTKSGSGYFYDDVLEYRVWIQNPDGDDYFYPFTTFEEARDFSEGTPRAEQPLVLIRQREWINEPEPGKYIHERGERITEWRVEWLAGSKRDDDSIRHFLEHPVGKK